MFGRKWPLLSTTAVSTVTVSASARNVGTSDGKSPSLFLPNFEGIFGASGGAAAGLSVFAGAVLADLRGRATVVLLSFKGPCCAGIVTAIASALTNAGTRTRRAFMLRL